MERFHRALLTNPSGLFRTSGMRCVGPWKGKAYAPGESLAPEIVLELYIGTGKRNCALTL